MKQKFVIFSLLRRHSILPTPKKNKQTDTPNDGTVKKTGRAAWSKAGSTYKSSKHVDRRENRKAENRIEVDGLKWDVGS